MNEIRELKPVLDDIWHEKMDVVDSSKLNTYLDCPRKYFYEYVLGWRVDRPNIHLCFGRAWHAAMEHLLNHGYYDIEDAYGKFIEIYREEFGPEMDKDMSPKNPERALNALMHYADHYDGDTFKVMQYEKDGQTIPLTEISGHVPISYEFERFLHFRLDAVLEGDQGYFWLDHKTSTRLSSSWADEWQLSFQANTYKHVLYCLYKPSEVYGGMMNGVFLYKRNDPKFVRVPLRATTGAMNTWLFHANYYYKKMVGDLKLLADSTADEPTLRAFPMNTQACTKYGTCPYHSLCCIWQNPLDVLPEFKDLSDPRYRCATGYKVEHWDPRDEDKTSNLVIDLTQEGTHHVHTPDK